MLSILSHQYTDSTDSGTEGETRTKDLKSRLGDQLDELAVFAFVAVAVLYIAAATYGLFF
ncbi:MAG TPA: hypothetical protein VEO55_09400 [Candidatus Dormibacteraeota bacterium]|jgi:hypothetical protein|nr:hypothetical protein [Candidatus Dormibacteraeota bacterium]